MKLLGIVILYYPDDAVVKNIATYLAQLDELMLWDNTPATDRRDLDLDSLEEAEGISNILVKLQKTSQLLT